MTKYNRREMLAAAGVATLAIGCGKKDDPEEATTPARSEVPLRVLWVGAEADAQTVQRAWAAVRSQPLKMDVVSLQRDNPVGVVEAVLDKYKRIDVLVYPLLATGELSRALALVPLSDDDVDSVEDELGRLLPTVRNGAAQFAGEFVATPIGARLPALLSTNEIDSMSSWTEYHRWVDTELSGQAAEPLSPGWAGAMFLWRAATTIQGEWLFDRDGLKPLVADEEYVDVLTQMVETAKRYTGERKSPAEIWNQLRGGQLRGGIGFPGTGEQVAQAEVDVNISDLPGAADTSRVLLDPFAMVASISSGCRQSNASKDLMNWMSGGEGSESLRSQVDAITVTRSAPAERRFESRQASSDGYERWLRERLTKRLSLPTLQLLAADEYYAVLEQQIGSAIAGDRRPAEALGELAAAWSKLHQRLDVQEQSRTWRRAQGMRA
ncbi:MAG: hypothetical protein HKN47_16130 [Pirellulaceae bacterium]|nr:hypothetical protein [Pirellulaceae bacterium]